MQPRQRSSPKKRSILAYHTFAEEVVGIIFQSTDHGPSASFSCNIVGFPWMAVRFVPARIQFVKKSEQYYA